jgi:glycosyltransferase involved in cell wall biosynthesis
MARILLPTIEAPGFKGGIARYIEAIKKTFPGNVEVTVFTMAPRSLRDLSGHLETWSYYGMLKMLWLRRKDYDQLWIQHVLPLGTAALAAKLLGGKPYVIFLHGLDFDLARQGLIRRELTKRILRLAKKVVTNSAALAGEVAGFVLGVKPLVVYPCVADEMVAAAKVIDGIKNDEVGLRLLTVARLVERKGHLPVLEAIKNLPEVRYDIVGDGPYLKVIEEKIVELGLGNRVTVHSIVSNDELVQFYRDADVFVMPAKKTATDREGFGIVYLEAGLFGLPVIANNTPGVDEAVIDNMTGTLIDGSVEELTKAIERYQNDERLGEEQGKRGRERVLAEFTRLAQMSKLDELLS